MSDPRENLVGMCIICNGGTHDDVMFDIASKLDRFGWTVQAVEKEFAHPGWTYTIGLIDQFDHPELVVAWCDVGSASGLIAHLVERIEDGERFDAGDRAATEHGDYEVVRVHDAQIEAGLLADWNNYYGAIGRHDLRLDAVQVKAPIVCDNHTLEIWSLDRPGPLLNQSDRSSIPAVRQRSQRLRPRGRG